MIYLFFYGGEYIVIELYAGEHNSRSIIVVNFYELDIILLISYNFKNNIVTFYLHITTICYSSKALKTQLFNAKT